MQELTDWFNEIDWDAEGQKVQALIEETKANRPQWMKDIEEWNAGH